MRRNERRKPLRLPGEEVVEEIRRVRRRIWQKSGGDVRRYVELLRQAADRSKAKR